MKTPQEWTAFLAELSSLLLKRDAAEREDIRNYSTSEHEVGTLVRAGATVAEVEAVEKRLGVSLPADYRGFLLASNGFPALGWASVPGDLLKAKDVQPLNEKDPETVDIWTDGGTDESMLPMEEAIAISETGDACDLMLCPSLISEDGEMECWKVASWIPGEVRYPSFAAWMFYEFKRVWLDNQQLPRFSRRLAGPAKAPFGLLPAECASYFFLALQLELETEAAVMEWIRGQVSSQKSPNPHFVNAINESGPNRKDIRFHLRQAGEMANQSSVLKALLIRVQTEIRSSPQSIYELPDMVRRLGNLRLASPALCSRVGQVGEAFSKQGRYADFERQKDDLRSGAEEMFKRITVLNGQWTG